MVSVGNKLVNLCTLRVTHEKADVRWTTGHSAKEDLKTVLALGGPYGRKERHNHCTNTKSRFCLILATMESAQEIQWYDVIIIHVYAPERFYVDRCREKRWIDATRITYRNLQ